MGDPTQPLAAPTDSARMVRRPTFCLVPLLTAALGCFHEQAPASAEHEPAAPLGLTLLDAHGARYVADEAPRDVEFVLTFGASLPPTAEPPLVMVPGRIALPLAERFATARSRGPLLARAVALDLTRNATELSLRPRSSLQGGALYTLLWLAPDATAAFPIATSRHPAWGARFAEGFPGHAEANAPPNLAAALLRFEGELANDVTAQVRLHGPDGVVAAQVDVRPCGSLGFDHGHCVWVAPSAPLWAQAHYELAIDAPLRSATGAPLAAVRIGFDTAAAEDREPPVLHDRPCASDELSVGALCALLSDRDVTLRGSVDQPALVSLALPPRLCSTLTYANQFELQMALDERSHALLRVVDLAGNVYEQQLALEPLVNLPQLSIDEVRSDPLGREPAQEFVELLNADERALSLRGFTLSTSALVPGRTIVDETLLAPGERALVVAPEFDARSEADGALPGGIRLLRLDAPLPLANGGARVVLRDALGRRLSSVAFGPPLVPGQCSARRMADRYRRARTELALDPHGGCTPGAATFDLP